MEHLLELTIKNNEITQKEAKGRLFFEVYDNNEKQGILRASDGKWLYYDKNTDWLDGDPEKTYDSLVNAIKDINKREMCVYVQIEQTPIGFDFSLYGEINSYKYRIHDWLTVYLYAGENEGKEVNTYVIEEVMNKLDRGGGDAVNNIGDLKIYCNERAFINLVEPYIENINSWKINIINGSYTFEKLSDNEIESKLGEPSNKKAKRKTLISK